LLIHIDRQQLARLGIAMPQAETERPSAVHSTVAGAA
jgi:hypothetical protein